MFFFAVCLPKKDKNNLIYVKEEIMKFIYCVLLIVAPLLLVGQNTLLTEDFNGGLHYSWFPTFPYINNITAAQNATAPSGDGWVGRLDNSVAGGVGAVAVGDVYTDFHYEANIFVPVDQATYYGIEFRVDTTGSDTTISSTSYQLICRFKPGMLTPRVRFRHRSGASPVTLQDWDNSTLPGGIPTSAAWHKLAVTCKADSFWLYYDDQLLPGCPITDATYNSGYVGLYYWDMTILDSVLLVDDVLVTDLGVNSIEDEYNFLPENLHLSQNYPNPFNPNTTIKFKLDKSEFVKLTIYNAAGELVKTLVDNQYSAGTHQIKWDATDLSGAKVSAGVYLYSLQTANGIETKKMILLK